MSTRFSEQVSFELVVSPLNTSKCGDSERLNAWRKWQQSDDAYVMYTGVLPDKLYTSIMV